MQNPEPLAQLVSFIGQYHGINDKTALSCLVQARFTLIRDRSVFFCPDYAVRFCKAQSRSFSNTVISLSVIQKYDDRPIVICVVTPQYNYLLLANSTFIRKVSQTSQRLSEDRIRGSLNGSDIIRTYHEISNIPENFTILFSIHEKFTFKDNLLRIVAATRDIQPNKTKFRPTAEQYDCIMNSPYRARCFLESPQFRKLEADLTARVQSVAPEILLASKIDNVNLRGRVVEFLITSPKNELKSSLITALRSGSPVPKLYTDDALGDYNRELDCYQTSTDIKTKLMNHLSNPKGYNIDKLLSFLATDRSVYLIYLIALDTELPFHTKLCSVFSPHLLQGTNIQFLWAGRDSRGVTQFDGKALRKLLTEPEEEIDIPKAEQFLKDLLRTAEENPTKTGAPL